MKVIDVFLWIKEEASFQAIYIYKPSTPALDFHEDQYQDSHINRLVMPRLKSIRAFAKLHKYRPTPKLHAQLGRIW
jgi:hypothetical protein